MEKKENKSNAILASAIEATEEVVTYSSQEKMGNIIERETIEKQKGAELV